MALDDAERSKLAEIERQLSRDAQMVHALRGTAPPLRQRIARAVYCAMAVCGAAFGALSLLTHDPVPIVLGSFVVCTAAAWLRWPGRPHRRAGGDPADREAPGIDGTPRP